MSKENEIPLKVLNLCAKGKNLDEAWAIYRKGQGGNAEAEGEEGKPAKLSAAEKKEKLAAQITELGGEPPAANASVAKFKEALAALQEETEEDDEEETEEEEGADLM